MSSWPQHLSAVFQYPDAGCNGAYDKLLHLLFPTSTSSFTITPRFLRPGSDNVDDMSIAFEVTYENNPVFVFHCRSSHHMKHISTRQAADLQMREHLGDLAHYCSIPRLHGVSAIGTSLCFYHLTTAHVAPEIIPLAILQHTPRTTDTAPVAQWDCEVLSHEGERRLQKVVEEIKAMVPT